MWVQVQEITEFTNIVLYEPNAKTIVLHSTTMSHGTREIVGVVKRLPRRKRTTRLGATTGILPQISQYS